MAGDDTKTCPFCKEIIREEALKCRFCGEWLEPPPSPAGTPQSAATSLPAFSLQTESSSPTLPKPLPQMVPVYRLGFSREAQAVFGAIILGNLLLSSTGATIVTILAGSIFLVYNFIRQQESVTQIGQRETHKDLSSWPSKGVLWWGAALTYSLRILNVGAYGSHIFLFWFLGFVIAVSVCLIWYRISKTRKRRKKFFRISGYILFGLGTTWVVAMLPSIFVVATSSPSAPTPLPFTNSFAMFPDYFGVATTPSAQPGGSGDFPFRAVTLTSMFYLLGFAGVFTAAYYLQFRVERKSPS